MRMVDRSGADLLENNNVQRFVARKRQAARRVGAGTSVTPTRAETRRATSAHSSEASRAARARPRVLDPQSRSVLASGPAPGYFGFALSLLILTAAAGAMGVVVVIWAVDSLIRRVTGDV